MRIKHDQINYCTVNRMIRGKDVSPVFSIKKLLLIATTILITALIITQVTR